MKKPLVLAMASLIVQSAAFAMSSQEIVCKTASGISLSAKLNVSTPKKDLDRVGPIGVVTLRDERGQVLGKENFKVALLSAMNEEAEIYSLGVDELEQGGYAGLSIPLSVYGNDSLRFEGQIIYAAPEEGDDSFLEPAQCSSKISK